MIKKYVWLNISHNKFNPSLFDLGKFDSDENFGVTSIYFNTAEEAQHAMDMLLQRVLTFGRMLDSPMCMGNDCDTQEERQSLHDRVKAGSVLGTLMWEEAVPTIGDIIGDGENSATIAAKDEMRNARPLGEILDPKDRAYYPHTPKGQSKPYKR